MTQEGSGLLSQTVVVEEITITAAGGKTVNIKPLMLELSYHEDIFSFAVSGYVSVRDGTGLIDGAGIVGNEDIVIKFAKTAGAANGIYRRFKIYHIGNREPLGNMTSETYKIHFCTEDLLLSEQLKVTKSYVGKSISEAVTDILKNELQSPDIFVIEPTSGIYDFNVNRKKPIEAISWLSTYAIPEQYDGGEDIAADMLFFETKHGLNFVSLRSLYNAPLYQTYSYQPPNTSSSPEEQAKTVLKFEFSNNFDIMKQISSGALSSKVWVIDPLLRTWDVHTYDYTSINPSSTLNGSSGLTAQKNRFGKTLNQMYDSSFKVIVGNSDQKIAEGIGKGEFASTDKVNSFANDIRAKVYIPKRSAQLSLIQNTVGKILIPGDTGISAGRCIVFNIPSKTNPAELDPNYSGKYLVTAVRHIVQSQGVFQTVLEISKESYIK